MSRIRIICANCGGDNCGRDAVAMWDEGAQEWALGSVYDNSWCDACGHDDPGLDEVELAPTELWHVGELPGDDGRTVRDENGLAVATFTNAHDAREAVAAMAALRASRVAAEG